MLLDTHVVAWLYEGAGQRFPEPARKLMESEQLSISPFVEMELTFLYEQERVAEPAAAPITALRQAIGLQVAETPLAAVSFVFQAAGELSWARNWYARMISAEAIAAGVPLVTANRTILDHLPLATWD